MKILLSISILFSAFLSAQIGIYTSNPLQTLHIDGSKNNPSSGTPSAAQQTDDFVVTSLGNIGMGTINPTTKLEINNGSTIGAIKIVDGTQGNNKVLMSDAAGVGSWSGIAGSWFGLLSGGSANGTAVQINFPNSALIGQGGSANTATNTIMVPSKGLYEITVSGWTNESPVSGSYLTTWVIRKNGTDILRPHYPSSGGYGTQTSTTDYVNLNVGDNITLFLHNYFGVPHPANQASSVALAVKLIQ